LYQEEEEFQEDDGIPDPGQLHSDTQKLEKINGILNNKLVDTDRMRN
jgi:hypothetical protein